MAFKLLNRVRVSVTGTPGTGDATLGSAQPAFQTFAAAGASDGDTFPYLITEGTAWEEGLGTYHSAGPSITRTTFGQSSTGSAITFSSAALVMATIRAEDIVGTLAGDTDVLLTSPADKDVLTYDVASSKWKNKPASGGGLFSSIIPAPPTQASTGLTSNPSPGTEVISDGLTGIVIDCQTSPAARISAVSGPAPATPYKIAALCAMSSLASSYRCLGIGFFDGTKYHLLTMINNNTWEIEKWNSATSYNSLDGSNSTFVSVSQPIWLHIEDDGTNVSFGFGMDGVNFNSVFSVAKSSGFLGGSGYTDVVFFQNSNALANTATLLGWSVT